MNNRPRIVSALAIAATVVGLLEVGIVGYAEQKEPVATWVFGTDETPAQPFDEVPKYDPMSLRIELPFAAYVYVVSFDHLRGSVCYYPTEFLATDHIGDDGRMHHFESGTHELPGPLQGKAQQWWVPDVTGALSLCVVASRQPIHDLEEMVPLMRQVGNKAFANRTMGSYMPRAGREKVIGRKALPHEVLIAAQNQRDSVEAGPMVRWRDREDVFVKVLNIRPGAPRTGATAPANPFQQRLQEMVREKSDK